MIQPELTGTATRKLSNAHDRIHRHAVAKSDDLLRFTPTLFRLFPAALRLEGVLRLA